MKTVTTRITGIFLLLIWLAPVIVTVFVYVQQSAIRHRMEEKLSNAQLQTLVLPEADVIWMDGHEILVNNVMFDIHSFSLKDGIYTFTGLYDEEETELMKNQEETTAHNQEKSKVLSQLIKWFQSTYKSGETSGFEQPIGSRTFISYAIASLGELFRNVDIPPPRS